jgi:hypothetical protein
MFTYYPFLSAVLQSLKDPGRLTYRRFLELFRHMVGLLGRVIGPSQGLYLHRTTQHRKTRANIHALSGIRTHDNSNQSAKTHASDRTAVTGIYPYTWSKLAVHCIIKYSTVHRLPRYYAILSLVSQVDASVSITRATLSVSLLSKQQACLTF